MFKTGTFKKRYISAALIFVGLAIGLAVLPEKYDTSQMQPEEVLLQLNDETRFVTTDYIADKIINNDPSFQLIDVRTPEQFAAFSLRGAINIPIENLLDKNDKGEYIYEGYLNQDVKKNVFYSNGTVYANQCWMITTRLNYPNNFVLKGGLNRWVETIMRPKQPKSSASDTEFALFSARKAASLFFGGGTVAPANTENKSLALPIPMKKKKGKSDDEGGC